MPAEPPELPGGPGAEGGAVRRRLRVPVPPGFPSGARCDVVETSARHGLRVLGRLPGAGCVLADGDRWYWAVPTGSDVDVAWPQPARYLVDAALLVPSRDLGCGEPGDREVVHPSGHRAPYTHPILLYFAVCCVAGVRPALTVS
ncbi:hypothetical protein V2S66_10800 [Streptomyces sp. V4-01]|uniref:Uncharacterized protein n=1 Tax=Actinacidiphila polyblastidii TaxID=3110430 RepID=A0ABU7PAX6_9ACTN|nr:hypothetical protein [Streptomyces sp. V4-01]